MRREQSPLYTTLLVDGQEHRRERSSVPVMYGDHEEALATAQHLYTTTGAQRIVIRHHDTADRIVRCVPVEQPTVRVP